MPTGDPDSLCLVGDSAPASPSGSASMDMRLDRPRSRETSWEHEMTKSCSLSSSWREASCAPSRRARCQENEARWRALSRERTSRLPRIQKTAPMGAASRPAKRSRSAARASCPTPPPRPLPPPPQRTGTAACHHSGDILWRPQTCGHDCELAAAVEPMKDARKHRGSGFGDLLSYQAREMEPVEQDDAQG